jgi:transposase-like protein
VVAGAVESGRGKARGRRLGRLRLTAVPDASATSLAGFLSQNLAKPASVVTDGWPAYAGLGEAGYTHEPVNLSRSWGDAALRLPGIHLVFGLAKRWLLGTHHGAVSEKHLPAYLDEYVFRFNRRTATLVSHGFARLIEQAVKTRPTTQSPSGRLLNCGSGLAVDIGYGGDARCGPWSNARPMIVRACATRATSPMPSGRWSSLSSRRPGAGVAGARWTCARC